MSADLFDTLRAILAKHRAGLSVSHDEPGHYALNRPVAGKPPKFVAAVQVKKSYVAFHLFPVYRDPGLLDGITPELRARMQGKSCFNFKSPDPALFAELEILTDRALGGAT